MNQAYLFVAMMLFVPFTGCVVELPEEEIIEITTEETGNDSTPPVPTPIPMATAYGTVAIIAPIRLRTRSSTSGVVQLHNSKPMTEQIIPRMKKTILSSANWFLTAIARGNIFRERICPV